MKDYLSGVFYGIKIAIKLTARIKNNDKLINVLFSIQEELEEKDFSSNRKIWKHIEYKYIKKYN